MASSNHHSYQGMFVSIQTPDSLKSDSDWNIQRPKAFQKCLIRTAVTNAYAVSSWNYRTFQLELGQWLADGRICKVRQCHVHSAGKLLLSSRSALKPSSHDTMPDSGELSHLYTVCLLGAAGNSPKPWHKAEGTEKLPYLIPECPPLQQPVTAAGTGRARRCFGCSPFLLRTPPTARIDSRIKALILCHQEIPFHWRTLLGPHPWLLWLLLATAGDGGTWPKHANSNHIHSLLVGAAVLQKSKT